MPLFFKIFLSVLPVMAALDLLWLGVIMKDFYRANLSHLMAGTVSWVPAILFYLLFAGGLLYFAILPGLQSGSLLRTAFLGALLGLFAYGTYDLTNHATLKEWPLAVTILDMAWGMVISGAVASVGYMAGKLFGA